MRYFSEIWSISENYKARQIYIRETTNELAKLTIKDTTDTSFIEEDVRPSSVPYREAIGYSCEFGCVAMALDYKRAKLHEYIKTAESITRCSVLAWDGVDKFTFGSERGIFNGSQELLVDTWKEAVKIDGTLAVWNNGTREIYPIYDILGMLCCRLGVNVMNYSYIKLYSSEGRYKTVIELDKSDDAQRFYMKMYMDVSRKGWEPI